MRVPAKPPTPAQPSGWIVPAGLVALTILTYANSLGGGFHLDDIPTILENPTIRHLGRIGEVLGAGGAGGMTSAGRPAVNLSLALNHALGGQIVWSYHVFNGLVHAAAGLALFGVLRRLLAGWPEEIGRSATAVAGVVSALWLVHPVQTAAVTYVVQRAEVMAALGVLLTVYAFQRSLATNRPGCWRGAAVAACLLGVASKETAAVAPLLVLLYDRSFVAGGFRAAWQARRGFYLALAACWLPLAWWVGQAGGRGGTAGFSTAVTPWTYLLTQAEALVIYLRLVVWPQPLVFDYGTALAGGIGDVAWQAVVVASLLAGSVWSAVRRSPAGFAGVAFFLLLAPSSSFIPVATQTMAEHRLYLALALPLTVLVVGGWRRWGPVVGWAGGVVAVVFAVLTVLRNETYASDRALWQDTVQKRPGNARAHLNLGLAEFEAGRTEAAIACYRESERLAPGLAEPAYNLGLALARLGRWAEAIEAQGVALAREPGHAAAHLARGNAWRALGHDAEAQADFEAALRLRPDYAEARHNLGLLRLDQGAAAEALGHFDAALRAEPDYADAAFNAGNALAALGRFAEALAHYDVARRLRPGHAPTENNAGNVCLELDRPEEALRHYASAVQIDHDFLPARRTLGLLLLHLGRATEARPHLEQVARAQPGDAEVAAALARLRGR